MLGAHRTRRKLQHLIKDWQTFRDAVLRIGKVGEITPDEEEQFLKHKARVAAQLPMLTGNIPRELAQEARDHSQRMTHILNRYERLGVDQLKDPEEREEFDHHWHQSYVFLNKLKGARLTEAVQPTPRKPPAGVPTGMPAKRPRRPIPGAWFFKFVIRLALIVLAIFLLGRGFGVRWDEQGRFVSEPPTGLKDFGATVVGVLAGILSTVWGWITSLFQPVVNIYGLEVTIILVAVFLLALGYWFFIRGR